MNWCFNEPWPTVANNSILNYPTVKKPAYEAVKNSLRDCMPSARIRKFEWTEGEFFSAELYMLNASPNVITDSIRAYILIDGNKINGMEIPHQCVVKGDSKSISIAAASILAKVSRDRYMEQLDKEYPQYMFKKHKGYPTKLHYELIRQYGPSDVHRKSFKLYK